MLPPPPWNDRQARQFEIRSCSDLFISRVVEVESWIFEHNKEKTITNSCVRYGWSVWLYNTSTYITSSYKHRVTIQQLVEVTTIHKYKRIITLQHDSATKDLIDLSSINTMYPSRIRIHGTSIHHPPPNNKWYAYAY